MKVEAITIKDIAKALNLSNATVSRALKDNYRISESTRQAVKAYAQENNYRPNLMAQSLKSHRSRSIGVSVCAIPNNFFAEVISGIESIASSHHYHVIITQSLESYEREQKNLEHLSWRGIDGLLASVSTETNDISHFRKMQDQGIPVVFFDRVTDQIKTHQVVVDNVQGAYLATRHLLENGFSRIAHITSSAGLSITRERLEGYYRALAEKNIPVNDAYIKYCQHGGMIREEVAGAIAELLALHPRPDALLTASDRITIRSLALLHEQNIAIPGSMAVAGFSNFSAPEIFRPALTTIRQPAFEMGKMAAELLIKLIERKKPATHFERVVLPIDLLVRDSSQMQQPYFKGRKRPAALPAQG